MDTRTFKNSKSSGSGGANAVLALAGNDFTGATVPQPVGFGDGVTYQFFGFQNGAPTFSRNMGNTVGTSKYTLTFKVLEGNTAIINGIQVGNAAIGTPGDSMRLSIQTTSSGNPTGTILASGLTGGSSGIYGQSSVTFGSPLVLSAPQGGGDVVFAIVIDRTGSIDAGNYWEIGCENVGGSNNAPFVFDGTNWTTSDLQPRLGLFATYSQDSVYLCAQTIPGSGYIPAQHRMVSIMINSGSGNPGLQDAIPAVLKACLGWVTGDASIGDQIAVAIAGAITGFTSLSPTEQYECDRSDGHIEKDSSTTSTTVVGRAILSDTMLIDRS